MSPLVADRCSTWSLWSQTGHRLQQNSVKSKSTKGSEHSDRTNVVVMPLAHRCACSQKLLMTAHSSNLATDGTPGSWAQSMKNQMVMMNIETPPLTFTREKNTIIDESPNCRQMHHLWKWHHFELLIKDWSQITTEFREEKINKIDLNENS